MDVMLLTFVVTLYLMMLCAREVVNVLYDIVLNSVITLLAVTIILMIDSVDLFPG